MIIELINTTDETDPAVAEDFVFEGLPAGGRVPAGATVQFTCDDEDQIDQALNAGLRAAIVAGKITMTRSGTDNRYHGLPDGQLVNGVYVASTPVSAASVAFDKDGTSLDATDVQAAIEEIDTYLDGLSADLVDYDNDTSALTATDVQGAIDEVVERVVALEEAPAGGGATVLLKTGLVLAGDWTFDGAPASQPLHLKLYAFGHETFGNVFLEVIGDIAVGEFSTINGGRPVKIAAGVTRINGGINFAANGSWTINEVAAQDNPFLGFTVTAVATF